MNHWHPSASKIVETIRMYFTSLKSLEIGAKVSGPYLPLHCLEWTQVYSLHWCVVGCGSKNGHEKDMCVEEIGECVHHSLTILHSLINIIGGGLISI